MASRLDIPTTLRALYPRARSRAKLDLVAPPHRASRRSAFLTVTPESLFILWLLVGGLVSIVVLSRLQDWLGWNMNGPFHALVYGAVWGFNIIAPIWRWIARRSRRRDDTSWALARGLVPVDTAHLESLPAFVNYGSIVHGNVRAWHAEVGARRLGIHFVLLRWRADNEDYTGYVARVRLPQGTEHRFAESSFERADRSTVIDMAPTVGRPLELECERLDRECNLRVGDGVALDWRQLFDPALVDLLDEGIDIEWFQRGDDLLLYLPGGEGETVMPARFDTLAVGAVALERRIATMLGNGVAVNANGFESPLVAARTERLGTYLQHERQRDLGLDIESQFAELGRFVSAEELANVRAKVESGQFPVTWLDDLIHHRRAAFWAAHPDAA